GKFIVASDFISGITTGNSIQLSPAYHDTTILFGLVFGEIGAVITMTAKALIEGKAVKIGRLSVDTTSSILGLFSLLFAGLAVSGKISVSAVKASKWASYAVSGWLLTIVPPSAVLALAWLLEKLMLSSISAREITRRALDNAVEQWEKRHADIE